MIYSKDDFHEAHVVLVHGIAGRRSFEAATLTTGHARYLRGGAGGYDMIGMWSPMAQELWFFHL